MNITNPKHQETIQDTKELVRNIVDKQLEENRVFYDDIYWERNLDLFDSDYNIWYEISMPSILDFVYSEDELWDYIDDIMKKVEMDARIRDNLWEENYRVIWVFKNPSETLFKLLSEYDFEYALIN